MANWKLMLASATWYFFGEIYHGIQKKAVFDRARKQADELGKPLVNYGCKYWRYAIDRSDFNIDAIPRNVPNFIPIPLDGRSRLPFEDKSVVIFCSHVIEHTYYPNLLLDEFNRISDDIFIITPNPLFTQTWMDPGHKRVYIGKYVIERPQTLLGPFLVGMFLLGFV